MGCEQSKLSGDKESNPAKFEPTHYYKTENLVSNPEEMSSSGDKLPLLLGRLNKPDSDWDKWGINELTRWCRESIRSRPYQSSIAILVISHEKGALLDLVSESYNGENLQSDAALRLRKGQANTTGAFFFFLLDQAHRQAPPPPTPFPRPQT